MAAVDPPLERESELDLMASLLADIGSSGGRVVLIRGEVGVGKTTLVREFLDRSSSRAHVVTGACDDLLTARPLGPFRDMTRDEPELFEALETGSSSMVMDTVLDLMSERSRSTVAVIEDVHWADDATLDVIRVVGRRIRDTTGLLLLTYRDGEVDHEHPLRGVMGALPSDNVVRIRLTGLSLEGVSLLVAESGLNPEHVFSVTGGNPFLTIEMASGDGVSVPASVQDSVLSRLRTMSRQEQEVLQLLSVVPERLVNSEVEAIVGRGTDLLAQCERSGFLQTSAGLVGFRHELIRRAVETSLTDYERAELNRQVLKLLPPGADPARMAHHARQAGDVEMLIEHAPVAARAARDAQSHHEAVGQFESLEPHLDLIDPSDRAAILEDWARSEHLLERTAEAIGRIARAQSIYRSVGDAAAEGRCGCLAVRLNELAKRSDEADRCMAEAIGVLEPLGLTKELAFAVSQQAWLWMMRGDDLRSGPAAGRAIDLAEQVDDEVALINALNTKGVVTYLRGEHEAGVAAFEQAARRARASGEAGEEIRALHNLTNCALSRLQLAHARRTADRACEAANRYRLPNLERTAQTDLAFVLFHEGAWDTAERIVEEALDAIPDSEGFAADRLYLLLGRLQARRGHPDGKDRLERSWALIGRSRELSHMAEDAAAQTEVMWLTGEVDNDRIGIFSELLEELLLLEKNLSISELVYWMWRIGELTEIPEGLAEPYRLLIEGEAASAARAWHELGYPYEQAIALSHGDTDAQLEAIAILSDLGAYATAAKLRRTLQKQGVEVPRLRRTARPAGGLTPRQTEVLALLAEQLTNVEIADRLFLSRRTVEHHVAAVMAKLGAKTRLEAVATATQQGLLIVG